ncbi:GTPase HflX [Chloropicon primus]|uniref:GTPase HflX n=1 Tax=Chloropicon primus TaxID=1764295 RepID=A0A5B8MHY9_9CHLO|nr:GTPase HflX [Chloropicon primus]UPQ99112.1 GTPase HflX [Chloropicon primus]|mmetsp:Transcript_13539/g.38081  ORF Transcript_13539/g.38081 Transcript_13539/m.38081 type:complete len:611 (-) Transcript_13539:80-1912(-)|eukprot:QDZ19901.1 GTPase HflX [Chloropicon primus]
MLQREAWRGREKGAAAACSCTGRVPWPARRRGRGVALAERVVLSRRGLCLSSLESEPKETKQEDAARVDWIGSSSEEVEVEDSAADFTCYDGENDWDEPMVLDEDSEAVYLVGVEFGSAPNFLSKLDQSVQDLIASGESLNELERLANAAGLRVVGATSQKLDKPRPATLIGKGKAFQVRDEARRLGATTVFFDCDLSPSQAKNLEKIMNKKSTNYFTSRSALIEAAEEMDGGEDLFGSASSSSGYYDSYLDEDLGAEEEEEEDCIELEKVTVADRTALILDIFSQRAATREGKLQVEMAQAQYQLPRLTRMWTHLERQSGGGGGASAQNRGMGETQIEVDKRLLRKRISLIKRELENVRSQREQFRRKRARANIPVVALVGYTNAGKSSLLNQLSLTFETPGQNNRKLVKARDQLFATLDPTTRKVRLPSGKKLLVTDTVGFVQQLPSTLIAAFRATLEEIGSADLLIHVVDVSSPYAYAHVDAVESTLREIPGASEVPVIHAWNKIDCIDGGVEPQVMAAATNRSNTVCISAQSGEGIDDLLEAIESNVISLGDMSPVTAIIPYDRGDLLDLIHSQGVMEGVDYLEEGTKVTAVIPKAHLEKFSDFAD